MSFVTHLESTFDGTRLPARTLQHLHGGKPLLVRYDLERIGRSVTQEALRTREPSLWRYAELLPLEHAAHRVSLGERITPLLECPRLAAQVGLDSLWIKDESILPTGSFKARGMAMAVSLAHELGVTKVAIPSAGNAGGALAAYAARAGMECFVFLPADTPLVNRLEAPLYGARTFLVNGLIGDCAKIVREGVERLGWFDFSTLKEPYRIEGKKTMGLELCEQLEWTLPDAIFYPTGGGTGLIGMWKAFAELEAIGWLPPGRRPRMYACQAEGCAPLPRAFAAGHTESPPIDDPRTIAAGLRVPTALGDFLVLRAVRESGGKALAAREADIPLWMHAATRLEGIALCPEAATCLATLAAEVQAGSLARDARVVVFNTGAAQKYVEAIACELPSLDHRAIDWTVIR